MSKEHDRCVDCGGVVEPGTCHVGLPGEPGCTALRLSYLDLGDGQREWHKPQEVPIRFTPPP